MRPLVAFHNRIVSTAVAPIGDASVVSEDGELVTRPPSLSTVVAIFSAAFARGIAYYSRSPAWR